jgi:hypothetical protein
MDADAHRAWVHLAWGEGTGAREHLERALELSAKLDMPQIARRAGDAMEAISGTPSGPPRSSSPKSMAPRPAGVFTLRRDRSEWTIEHAGRSFRLKDVRGLGMLAQLVDNAGREIHVLDLAADGESDAAGGAIDLGDAGDVIDLRARDAYKTRIADLREELAEAAGPDPPRSARVSRCSAAFGRPSRRSPITTPISDGISTGACAREPSASTSPGAEEVGAGPKSLKSRHCSDGARPQWNIVPAIRNASSSKEATPCRHDPKCTKK